MRQIKVIPPFQISTAAPIPVTLAAAITPTIVNVPMAVAGTEYNFTFPVSTKQFTVRTRLAAKLQLSYTLGATNTVFITAPRGTDYYETGLALIAPVTLYFLSDVAANVLEVTYWV